jgi:uncharacterized membrane protein (DUF4010 family)
MSLKLNYLFQFLAIGFMLYLVLTVLPDVNVGPYLAINLRDIATLFLAIFAISVFGGMLIEIAHFHQIFLMTGFLAGFASSTASVIAMANLTKHQPEVAKSAATAAIASSIATYIQLAFLIGVVSSAMLMQLALPIFIGAFSTLIFCWLSASFKTYGVNQPLISIHFLDHLKKTLFTVCMLSLMMILIVVMQEKLGIQGVNIAAFLSGLVDGHASAISFSEMVALKKMSVEKALLPILIGLSSNTLFRSLLSLLSGNRLYFTRVAGALLSANLLVWLTIWLMGHSFN